MKLLLLLNFFFLLHGLRLPTQEEFVTWSWDSSKEGEKFNAVIFHSDNRPLNDKDPSEVTIEEMSFVEMASLVDYAYAKKHGYTFRHYVLPRSVSHPKFGPRYIAWAKLLALKHVSNEFPDADVLLMHDSDTAIANHEYDIPEFMEKFVPGEYDSTDWDGKNPYDVFAKCKPIQDHEKINKLKQGSVWLNQGCKGHFALLKPSAQAWKILKKAWNFQGYENAFPWEQAAWDRLAALKTDGLMMIGGVEGSLRGDKCGGADIQIYGFNHHECHFQDDTMLMGNGDGEARDRIRKDLGCGADWENKCLSQSNYAEKLHDHDLHRGKRKLQFLSLLKESFGYNDQGIHKLYREMRATVRQFTEKQAEPIAAEFSENPEHINLHSFPNQTYGLGYGPFRDFYKNFYKNLVPTIPEGRGRQCWCDSP